MFRSINELRLGSITGETFKTREFTRRANNLSLSTFVDFQNTQSSTINTVDVAYNGSMLLSGCMDGSVHLHSLRNYTSSCHHTCRLIHKVDQDISSCHVNSVETVQWYPFDDALFVTSGTDRTLKIWDTNTALPIESIKFKSIIHRHDIAPLTSKTSSLVALATSKPYVHLLDMRTGSNTHKLSGHSSAILCVKWSPVSDYTLASGGDDQKVILWDVRSASKRLMVLDQNNQNSGKNSCCTSHDGIVNAISYTTDGLYLVSLGSDNQLKLWNVKTGKHQRVNYGHVPNSVRSVQIDVSDSPTKENVFIPSGKYVFVYNVHTGKMVKRLSGHFSTVTCCRYFAGNAHLYSGGSDNLILCWACEQVEPDCEENDRNQYIMAIETASREEDIL